jgi:2-polyprenyl-3-methyl-5-hydroxy-6-metoxy-1,4-benzoquinol methylase
MSKFLIGHIDNCQICGFGKLEPLLRFGHMPRVHGHLTEAGLGEPEIKYPLNVVRCPKCFLVQIDYAVDPKIVFPPDYPYHSGTTNMLIRNFRSLAKQEVEKLKLTKKDLVVDIGSNDGTLLSGFKEEGTKVLGIEPTDNAKIANKAGIKTIQKFFTSKLAKEVAKKYGHASIVTAANVFAHINNLFDLLDGVKALIGKKGVFISESQYLRPLITLFKKVGMSLVDAEQIEAAGGSIRVFAKVGKHPLSARAKQLIKEEEELGLYDKGTLDKFATRAVEAKQDLLKLLIDAKRSGAIIGSVGAPGRSNTLLNFARVDHHLLDYLCEWKNSPKIGMYAPGTQIQIVDESRLIDEQPEYALVLSWHIGIELMKKIRAMGYKGKFIMPLPAPRIVEDI